jgi:hypothetical protein
LFPNDIVGTFNQVVALGVGTLKIYDEFNTLIVTFTEEDITLVDNEFTIDNSAFTKTLKSYYIIITEGLFIGLGCNSFKVSNINEFTFEIIGGQYDPEDYDTTNDYT